MSLDKTAASNTCAESLAARGMAAAAKFALKRGMELIETSWPCEIGDGMVIAEDDDESLCFIVVSVDNDTEKPFPNMSYEPYRAVLESAAISFLAQKGKDYADRNLRFDHLNVKAITNDRAILRYHASCLASAM